MQNVARIKYCTSKAISAFLQSSAWDVTVQLDEHAQEGGATLADYCFIMNEMSQPSFQVLFLFFGCCQQLSFQRLECSAIIKRSDDLTKYTLSLKKKTFTNQTKSKRTPTTSG